MSLTKLLHRDQLTEEPSTMVEKVAEHQNMPSSQSLDTKIINKGSVGGAGPNNKKEMSGLRIQTATRYSFLEIIIFPQLLLIDYGRYIISK